MRCTVRRECAVASADAASRSTMSAGIVRSSRPSRNTCTCARSCSTARRGATQSTMCHPAPCARHGVRGMVRAAWCARHGAWAVLRAVTRRRRRRLEHSRGTRPQRRSACARRPKRTATTRCTRAPTCASAASTNHRTCGRAALAAAAAAVWLRLWRNALRALPSALVGTARAAQGVLTPAYPKLTRKPTGIPTASVRQPVSRADHIATLGRSAFGREA